ncbi:MarR family transcriptional regulator [Noviherbaspirillum galbum]|uniref:MarR family transcriptional regulator n=1 Tax=Noviherbaspirillum galbum TaxID=2709383 RepID=A0A6B3SWG4_9BURK|nr:MarR family transcriptional regulator [Noviherbaspirillum galbum]NEX64851.1 MarR family transcriptional regulator [Noviherbaspirillum galbum]
MSTSPLRICLDRHHRQAALSFKLDDELGILHGISWADFVLLDALDAAEGALSTADLAKKLSVPRSRLLLQLMPLEKIGLIARRLGADGVRCVCLRPNGQRKICEAQETAAKLCEEFLGN